jgi:hypothetical protein
MLYWEEADLTEANATSIFCRIEVVWFYVMDGLSIFPKMKFGGNGSTV